MTDSHLQTHTDSIKWKKHRCKVDRTDLLSLVGGPGETERKERRDDGRTGDPRDPRGTIPLRCLAPGPTTVHHPIVQPWTCTTESGDGERGVHRRSDALTTEEGEVVDKTPERKAPVPVQPPPTEMAPLPSGPYHPPEPLGERVSHDGSPRRPSSRPRGSPPLPVLSSHRQSTQL